MATNVTLRNILVMVSMVATLLGMFQWRFAALQNQLDERMNLYSREINRIEQRLEKLEFPR